MPTEQILLHLLADLLQRFRQAVPNRERSACVRRLLEQALLQASADALYRAALAAERDAILSHEMAEWAAAAIDDGLRSRPRRRRR